MIIYKLFKTPKNYYVYDRNRNRIIELSEDDYIELEKLQNNQTEKDEVKCLRRYQKHGFLTEDILEEVIHPETNHVNHFLSHRCENLTLQVTQNCNLRCAYCAYSGKYENRVHSNEVMTWETAKKAIDHLFSHSHESKSVHVAFYGGEPLLAMDLIKKSVAYIKENFSDRTVTYGLTTNGTLLTIENGEFLIDNNFAITISLDGSKDEHDKNRVFANGKGSFDSIMHNIKELNKYDNRFIKHLRFNTVLSPSTNYGAVRNYFESEDIVCDANVGLSLMESSNCKENIVFGDEFLNQNRYDYLKMLLIMTKKMKHTKIPNVSMPMRVSLINTYLKLSKNLVIAKRCQHSGPCIPGVTRMFVTTNRDIYSCEKTSERSGVMRMGNLDTGIEIDKVKSSMNFSEVCNLDCKNCWAFNWCSMCAVLAEENGTYSSETAKSNCDRAKLDTIEEFETICVLKEFGYDFEKEELYD